MTTPSAVRPLAVDALKQVRLGDVPRADVRQVVGTALEGRPRNGGLHGLIRPACHEHGERDGGEYQAGAQRAGPRLRLMSAAPTTSS